MDTSFYNKKKIHVYIPSSACGLTNWPWVVLVRLVLGQWVTQFSEPHTDDAGGDKHDGGHQRVEENERHHPHLGPVMHAIYAESPGYSSIWHHTFIYKDKFCKTWAFLLGEVSKTHSSLCIELQVPDTLQNMTSTNKLTPHSKCPKCIIWCINNVYILITRKKSK